MTSAPWEASARAWSESTLRVRARAGERTLPVGQDRADQAAALRAGCAHDGNDFLVGHHLLLDLFSKTDGGIASTNRVLVSPRRAGLRHSDIDESIRRRNPPAVS